MKKHIVSLLIIIVVVIILLMPKDNSQGVLSQYNDIKQSIDKLASGEIRCNLAFINDDDIPELVVDVKGYYEGIIVKSGDELFTIGDGEFLESTKIENSEIKNLDFTTLLGYGTSGRTEYKYYPKTGIVFCEIASPEEIYVEYYKLDGACLIRVDEENIKDILKAINVNPKIL